jgi:thymidylate kinase
MNDPGTLIAVEGIDGSGKQTQVRLLARELESRGYLVLSTGFPQYGSWFGKMVGQFLNGDLGPLNSVDPHFAALLYAGDRFECKQPIVSALEKGVIVLADRYVASSLAHQAARAAPEKRAEFRAWIEHLEYCPGKIWCCTCACRRAKHKHWWQRNQRALTPIPRTTSSNPTFATYKRRRICMTN